MKSRVRDEIWDETCQIHVNVLFLVHFLLSFSYFLSFLISLWISSYINIWTRGKRISFKTSNLRAHVDAANKIAAIDVRRRVCCTRESSRKLAKASALGSFLVLMIFCLQIDWRTHIASSHRLRDTFLTTTRRQWLLSRRDGVANIDLQIDSRVRTRRSALTHFPLRTPPRVPSPALDRNTSRALTSF